MQACPWASRRLIYLDYLLFTAAAQPSLVSSRFLKPEEGLKETNQQKAAAPTQPGLHHVSSPRARRTAQPRGMFSLSMPQETCLGDHPGAHERAVFMLKAKFEGIPALAVPLRMWLMPWGHWAGSMTFNKGPVWANWK